MADAELGIKVTTQGVTQAASDLDKLDASAKKAAQSAKDLGTAQKTATSGASATAKALGDISGAAKGVDDAHKAATASTRAFREAMHVLDPVLASTGASMGGFSGFVGAARAGIAGLAIAIGGSFIAGLEAAADKVDTLRKSVTALSAGGGEFKKVQQTARDTGVSLNAVADITNTLNRAFQNNQTVKFVGDLSSLNNRASDVAKVFSNLIKASGADENAVAGALKGIATEGKLTVDIFDKLVDANSAVALAFAKGFGKTDIASFRHELELAPKTVDEVRNAVLRIGPAAQDAADKTGGLSSALGQLKQGILDVSSALSGPFASATASSFGAFLSLVGQAINKINELNNQTSGVLLQTLPFLGPLFGNPRGIVKSTQPQQPPSDLFTPGLGPGFVSPGSIGTGGGSFSGNTETFFPDDNSGFSTGEFFNTENFATGGSFMVGGSGGTDKTPVRFNATRGEIVTITPPGGNTGTANSSLQNAIGQSGSRTVSSITGAKMDIVSAINRMNTNVSGALQNVATATATATQVFIQQGNDANTQVPQVTGYRIAGGMGGFGGGGGGGGPSFGYNAYGYDPYTSDQYDTYDTYVDPNPGTDFYKGDIAGFSVASSTGFAKGGSFMVGGSGATDRTPVRFRATRGERVTIDPPGMSLPRQRIGGRNMTINLNVNGVTSPAAFVVAGAQIKRALRRQFR